MRCAARNRRHARRNRRHATRLHLRREALARATSIVSPPYNVPQTHARACARRGTCDDRHRFRCIQLGCAQVGTALSGNVPTWYATGARGGDRHGERGGGAMGLRDDPHDILHSREPPLSYRPRAGTRLRFHTDGKNGPAVGFKSAALLETSARPLALPCGKARATFPLRSR